MKKHMSGLEGVFPIKSGEKNPACYVIVYQRVFPENSESMGKTSTPGDSSRDLFKTPIWAGHVSPLSSGHVNSPSQKGHQQNCQAGFFSHRFFRDCLKDIGLKPPETKREDNENTFGNEMIQVR